MQSCRALGKRDAWREVCSRAESVDGRSAASVRSFFASGFDAYRVLARRVDGDRELDTRDSGLMTGYYEPLLRGSRARSERFATPVYRVPEDLLVIDLGSVYPEVANLRLRGKLQGRRVVPYPSRGEITGTNLLAGQELLWVDDPVDAFFLQVQGSGRVRFDDGSMVRLGYGDQNGQPYRSIGRWLVDQGEMTLDEASMAGIKSWIARNPSRAKELLDQNPSFVFFRELPLGDPAAGPVGALGVPLTPGASACGRSALHPAGVAAGDLDGRSRQRSSADPPDAGAGHRRRDPRPAALRFLLGLRRGCRSARRPTEGGRQRLAAGAEGRRARVAAQALTTAIFLAQRQAAARECPPASLRHHAFRPRR